MLINEFFDLLKKKKIPIIIDDSSLSSLAQNYSDEVIDHTDFDFQGQSNGLLLTTSSAFVAEHLKTIAQKNQSKIMLFPLMKHIHARFHSTCKTTLIEYSLNALVNSFSEKLMYFIEKMDSIISNPVTLRCHCEQAQLTLQLHSINKLNCPTTINFGDLFSPYPLFEYALFQSSQTPRYALNGFFSFNSLLVSGLNQDEKLTIYKDRLLEKINHSTRSMLFIKDSQVDALWIDGENHLHLIDKLGISRKVVEIAFGINDYMTLCFDRTINSPMNEGILGTHIGIGSGKNEYHLDFISPDITFNNFI